jgi:hypothetical protein
VTFVDERGYQSGAVSPSRIEPDAAKTPQLWKKTKLALARGCWPATLKRFVTCYIPYHINDYISIYLAMLLDRLDDHKSVTM